MTCLHEPGHRGVCAVRVLRRGRSHRVGRVAVLSTCVTRGPGQALWQGARMAHLRIHGERRGRCLAHAVGQASRRWCLHTFQKVNNECNETAYFVAEVTMATTGLAR